jgi:biotin carboxyl carrier protein
MAEQAMRQVWAIRQQQQQRQQLQQQQLQQQQQPSTAQPQPSPSSAQPVPTPPPPTQPAPPPQPTGALPPASNVLAGLMHAVAQTPGQGDVAEGGTAEPTSPIDWMLQLGNNINAGDVVFVDWMLGGQGDPFAAPSQVGIFSPHPLEELLS